MVKLGRLQKVDLRDVWLKEDTDFTPWLAKSENIQLLGEAIGIDLIVEAEEKMVGPFRADILCKDEATNNWVLIENQLEKTDHKHLGQLLTYATGLDAVTIIWVASEFNEEHRATLDWLNKITDQQYNFFGVKIELYKILDTERDLIKTVLTNEDGRIDGSLLSAENLEEIHYELLFFAGDYLKKQHSVLKHVFLDKIPIRFFVSNKYEHYHIPLLLSPFGYSTYRGS